MKFLVTRWLVLAHRWLAIGTCLLFASWFISGLVLMYVDFPNLTARERAAMLRSIDWQRVQLTPSQAMRLPEVTEFPRELRLEMMGNEPIYRIEPGGSPPITVSALTGRVVSGVSAGQARDLAARSMSAKPVTVRTVTRDQWTVSSAFDVHRPLHVVRFDDEAKTDLYVSSRDGDIVLDTTARERRWNWVGAVIHWIYFSDLRTHPAAWRQGVLWLSGIGIVVAISGLWLGIDRLRLRRRTRGASVTPFRGWQAWHHIAGVLGGVFLLTWIFSGWLSMDPPGPWSADPDMARIRAGIAAYRGHEAPDFETSLDVLHGLAARDVRTASFSWLGGRPLIALGDGSGAQRVVAGESGASVELQPDVVAAAASLVPGAHVADSVVLSEPDAYWYSHREERTLPALRIRYDDVQHTWIYLDPVSGTVLARIDASGRLHRWLFNALHSLDFHWLLATPRLRDAVMWLLSIAGLTVSLSGVVLGVRRLRRA